jgi:hypothetical protein
MAYIRGKQAASNLADCGCGRQQPQLSGYRRKSQLHGLQDEAGDLDAQIKNLRQQYEVAKKIDPQRARELEAEIKRQQQRLSQVMNSQGGQNSGSGGNEKPSWFKQQTLIDGVDNWIPVTVGGAVAAAGAYYALC